MWRECSRNPEASRNASVTPPACHREASWEAAIPSPRGRHPLTQRPPSPHSDASRFREASWEAAIPSPRVMAKMHSPMGGPPSTCTHPRCTHPWEGHHPLTRNVCRSCSFRLFMARCQLEALHSVRGTLLCSGHANQGHVSLCSGHASLCAGHATLLATR